MLEPKRNVPLNTLSAMRLGGDAAYLSEVTDRAQIPELVNWATAQNLPIVVVGEGSNIVWKDEGFAGLVLVNRIPGFEIQTIDEKTSYLIVGAGEHWDNVVERAVQAGLAGIELLSKIPGTAGAGPIQNIGAYGSQLSDTLLTLTAYDLTEKKLVNLSAQECSFGYRTSRFKTADKGRYIITEITLQLHQYAAQPPYYRDIQAYLDKNNISEVTLPLLREIVTEIRKNKLPDPSVVANNGSFFQNPIISRAEFDELAFAHPEINMAPGGWSQPPRWEMDDGRVKLSAGWLMDQCGFKDMHDPETGMATWPTQTLVLVNEHAKNTADLLAFKQKIVSAVQQKFGIELVQEPELLP